MRAAHGSKCVVSVLRLTRKPATPKARKPPKQEKREKSKPLPDTGSRRSGRNVRVPFMEGIPVPKSSLPVSLLPPSSPPRARGEGFFFFPQRTEHVARHRHGRARPPPARHPCCRALLVRGLALALVLCVVEPRLIRGSRRLLPGPPLLWAHARLVQLSPLVRPLVRVKCLL